jgi:hypothetical protein
MSGWRPHIESALCLDLRRMLASGALHPGCITLGSWVWTNTSTGERVASVGYSAKLTLQAGELTLTYSHCDRDGERKDVQCCVGLRTLPLNYGGLRWYFICPYTGRRTLKLYKWNGIEWFCHRTAIRPLPTYASQRVGGHDRVNSQRWALRRRLGDDVSDLCGEPMKPKRMRWRTFQKYLDRDADLDARDGLYLCRLFGRLDPDSRALLKRLSL